MLASGVTVYGKYDIVSLTSLGKNHNQALQVHRVANDHGDGMMMKFKADFIAKVFGFGLCLRHVVGIYGNSNILSPGRR